MTHPYWPLTKNSYIEYEWARWDGGFHPADMSLGVGKRWSEKSPFSSGSRFRMTCLSAPNTQIPMVMRVSGESGVVPLADGNWPGALFTGVWDGPGVPAYIGECGGVSCVALPPEPYLTCTPVAGETFTVDCGVTLFPPVVGSVQQSVVKCRYRTMGVGVAWGAEADVVRTALEERYDAVGQPGNIVYNYVYKRGVGLIDAWWGPRGEDDLITGGWQMYAVGWGGQ